MLLAETLLLLLLDDVTGKPTLDSTRLDLALAGAVLAELAQRDRVAISGPDQEVKAGRLVVRDAGPTGHPVLDRALALLADRPPAKAGKALHRLAKGLRRELLDGLVGRHVLRVEEGRLLGIFPTTTWPAVDVAHEREVRQGLRDVLLAGRRPTPPEVTLVALLGAVDRVLAVLGPLDVPKRDVRRRAKDIAADDLAGQTVRAVLAEVNAAVTAAVAAAAG